MTKLPAESQAVLDPWRDPRSAVRLEVVEWCLQFSVPEQFVVRPRSLRIVWNYVLRVGPRAVWRKIVSRMGEERRNQKIAGIGVGRVLEAPPGFSAAPGSAIVFFSPNGSAHQNHLSLDKRLVLPIPSAQSVDCALPLNLPQALALLVGWSPFSGEPLDEQAVQVALAGLLSRSSGKPKVSEAASPTPQSHKGISERVVRQIPAIAKPTAVVFGFGNYAKTQIVPVVRKQLSLSAIHELDTDLASTALSLECSVDTSPWPRPEKYDAWFIAGYHHTHAPLAIKALESGAYAVVEKPIATTRQDFEALSLLASARPSRLFSCFHKRYSSLNDNARADLRTPLGDPIDMHCLVYEIPLPALHWYNWPSSGSRLISNGCHWLDYFMFINDFQPVTDSGVRAMRGKDLAAFAVLANGAQFSMTITDTGSPRLGVRDVIDLRAGDVTVRIIDSTEYVAENTSSILRKRRVNPMKAYTHMYETICSRIVRGLPGDSISSLSSTALMLELEDDLTGIIAPHPRALRP